MSFVAVAHLCYLAISILITVWVGRTLFKAGHHFVVDAFSGNEELAAAVNRLLVVGFYLVNVGFVALAIRSRVRPQDVTEAVENVSIRVGTVLLVLAGMHFFNMLVLARIRRRGMMRHVPPPVGPMGQLRQPYYAQPVTQTQPYPQANG